MTLSAPTHLNLRAASAPPRPPTAKRPGQRRPKGTVLLSLDTAAAPRSHVLMVEFASPDRRSWRAVGGGDTFADAIAFAQDSCPTDATWQPISWNDLYGD